MSLDTCSIEKIDTTEMTQNFYLFKILRAHILPLTNCAFNKSGDRMSQSAPTLLCHKTNPVHGLFFALAAAFGVWQAS
jgi:dynein assembly factor with WDR repeat domains 1